MSTHTLRTAIRVLGIFCLSCLSAKAATYYIDYSSGNDSNNGTSTSTPWQHSPGDPRATGTANRTLAAGDMVVFKGGVTYSFSTGVTDYIAANASGSAGNVITYISGDLQSPQWGATRAVIDVQTPILFRLQTGSSV